MIIRGEPGCGKSTRVPQYLLEYWVKNQGLEPVRIICTQPRRLAAISLAERVANERQERVSKPVVTSLIPYAHQKYKIIFILNY